MAIQLLLLLTTKVVMVIMVIMLLMAVAHSGSVAVMAQLLKMLMNVAVSVAVESHSD